VATDAFDLVDQPGEGLRDGDVARVGHIVDGDTLDVIVGGEKFKVRIQGMNTPECDKEQDDRTHRYECVSDDEGYGMASYRAAVDVLEGAHVKISCDDVDEGDRCETDPYDRYLAYLEIPCFGDFGKHLVERGLAQTFTRYDSSKRAEYCRAEYAAREARRGMWEGGSISSMLEEMSQSTRSWYRTHDARCDAAIEELSNSSP
jgi:endonuclease YncB( thermonuclease family)